MTTDDIDRLARKRAKAKIGWFIHAAIYATVNLGLLALSAANGRAWAVFPLLGWGVGLLAHGISVWLLPPGGALLERMTERERTRLTGGAKGDPW
ncbi:2TM domain-containing protein [Variovorax sp. YR216]|uniref:2TM domain-containing protein n=1 Tax=Variovorax sp. YR216 TaxID=1882828 RepID=UPI000894581F|nr:2TM domain-containing protein [Variovorax sp. YR216]SEA19637.1 2TM domain-containing protein [Variovorax sp. YR216]